MLENSTKDHRFLILLIASKDPSKNTYSALLMKRRSCEDDFFKQSPSRLKRRSVPFVPRSQPQGTNLSLQARIWVYPTALLDFPPNAEQLSGWAGAVPKEVFDANTPQNRLTEDMKENKNLRRPTRGGRQPPKHAVRINFFLVSHKFMSN